MARGGLDSIYEGWLLEKVCDKMTAIRYKTLFSMLYQTPVNLNNMKELDCNRTEDGRMLRFRFENEHNDILGIFPKSDLTHFEDCSCSLLELMIALSLRMEEQIIGNINYGDRTGQWFWEMLTNLGVGYMTDDRFNVSEYHRCVSNFMNYEYDTDGKGCLFRSEHKTIFEMQMLDVWYQMCEHLKDIN